MRESGKAFNEFIAKKGRKKASEGVETIADMGRARSLRGKRISIHLRLTVQQWKAAHAFALEENTTVQGLFIAAATRLFHERGRPFSEPEKPSLREAFDAKAPKVPGSTSP